MIAFHWEWEQSGPRVTARASGTGTVTGHQVSLTGYATGAGGPFSFMLTRDGAARRLDRTEQPARERGIPARAPLSRIC